MSKLKAIARAATLAAALLCGAAVPQSVSASEISDEAKPVAPPQPTESAFKRNVELCDRLYAGRFDKSLKDTTAVFSLLEQIRSSPDFSKLDGTRQAELFHREAVTKLTFNRNWFKESYRNFDKEQAESLKSRYAEIGRLLEQAIETDLRSNNGKLSAERQQTLDALIENSQAMAENGIVLVTERPDLGETGKPMIEQSPQGIQKALQVDNRMRYVGNGLYVFAPAQRTQMARGIVGLAKHSGDLSEDFDTERAVLGLQGALYRMEKDVLPWANDVFAGKYPATPAEKAFIAFLAKDKVLIEGPNGYTSGVKHLTITPPDTQKFTHEIAHLVYYSRPEYVAKAREWYGKLSAADRDLFDNMMLMQNANMDEATKLAEFFAYDLTAGFDWRVKAGKLK